MVEVVPGNSDSGGAFGGTFDKQDHEEKKIIVAQAKQFQLLVGCLYHYGHDGILILCIGPNEYECYLTNAHKQEVGSHCSFKKTYQRLKRLGVFWQDMR